MNIINKKEKKYLEKFFYIKNTSIFFSFNYAHLKLIMTTKRVYAMPIMPPFINRMNSDFITNKQQKLVKGFIPIIHQRFRSFKLDIPKLYTISDEEFSSTVKFVIEQVYGTGELPPDYNQKIIFFQASSKTFNYNFINNTIYETLRCVCQKEITCFGQCENIKQISHNWCKICEISSKIEYIIYYLPHDKSIIDILCELFKELISSEQKQKIVQVVIHDFAKFEKEELHDMKEAFDFLCKVEIYSDDFHSKIESTVLSYFETVKSTIGQITLSEKLHSLSDTTNFLVHFSSFILKVDEIKRLTCELNNNYSNFIFEYLEKELPNLIEFHQIQEIKTFLKASNTVNNSFKFTELLNISFSKYAENLLKTNSNSGLFRILNDITNYLLDLCNALGKRTSDILIQSFRKIANKNSYQIASIVAFGIDNIIRNQLEFNISTIFFLFKLLESKDTFEAYHANLLMKRIRHNNGDILLPDLMLVDEIRSYCGDFYTKRFDLLINGADFSKRCFDSFCNEFDVPDVFNVFLLNSNLMSVFSTNLSDQSEVEKLPQVAKIISEQYFAFLRDNYPNRKFQWCLQLTEVELKCTINDNNSIPNPINDDKSDIYYHNELIVKCNAYCASFILSFNDKIAQTLQDIHEKTKLNEDEIETLCSMLISPKIGLIRKVDNQYYINYATKKNIIKIPTLTSISSSIDEEEHRNHILDNQIDCLIIKLLKNQRCIHKNDLFQNIVNEIGNQVTEERYTKRIENLKRKYFLSESEYETINYIP